MWVATCRAGRYDCCPLPDTQGDLVDYLREIRFADDLEHADSIVVLEQVGGFAGVGRSGSSIIHKGVGLGTFLPCGLTGPAWPANFAFNMPGPFTTP